MTLHQRVESHAKSQGDLQNLCIRSKHMLYNPRRRHLIILVRLMCSSVQTIWKKHGVCFVCSWMPVQMHLREFVHNCSQYVHWCNMFKSVGKPNKNGCWFWDHGLEIYHPYSSYCATARFWKSACAWSSVVITTFEITFDLSVLRFTSTDLTQWCWCNP